MKASVMRRAGTGGGSADVSRDANMITVLTGPLEGSGPAHYWEGGGPRSERRPRP